MALKDIGDRRHHIRFEIMGALNATVSSTETLDVLNLGVRGALVEASMALQANAEYAMRLILETNVVDVTARVRRVTEIGRDSSTFRYLMGLEFLGLSPEAEEAIGRVVSLGGVES